MPLFGGIFVDRRIVVDSAHYGTVWAAMGISCRAATPRSIEASRHAATYGATVLRRRSALPAARS